MPSFNCLCNHKSSQQVDLLSQVDLLLQQVIYLLFEHVDISLQQVDMCNKLRCPLARLSGLQCFNMGHNGHGINLYGVIMILMGN